MADAIGPPASRPFLEFRPLLRAPGIASDARKIILATVGLLVFYAGSFGLGRIFPDSPLLENSSLALPGSSMAEEPPEFSTEGVLDALSDIAEPFRTLTVPLAAFFVKDLGPGAWLQAGLIATWGVVVWGIFGGAIARIAVVQAAAGHQVGLGSALRFALRKSGSLIGAPLTPMLAVGLLAGGCALFGLLYRIPAGIGGWIATVLGFVPLLLSLVMALILVGLGIGWPLMHATIAAEGEDAPDALSRSYSYVNQRLVRYLAHAAVSLMIGAIGLMAVILFARVVLNLAGWGVSLGAPDLKNLGDGIKDGRLFWDHAVGLLVLAWVYSYFWSAASIIYLILRRDVDGTPWHDVYLAEHAGDTFAGEPASTPLKESDPAAIVAP